MQNNGIDLTTSNNGLGPAADLSEYVYSIWTTASSTERRSICEPRVSDELLTEATDLLSLLSFVEKTRRQLPVASNQRFYTRATELRS